MRKRPEMRQSDIAQLSKIMATAGIALGVETKEERVRVYFEYLKDYEISEVMAAFDRCIRSSRFFPTIAEITDMVTAKKLSWGESSAKICGSKTERIGESK